MIKKSFRMQYLWTGDNNVPWSATNSESGIRRQKALKCPSRGVLKCPSKRTAASDKSASWCQVFQTTVTAQRSVIKRSQSDQLPH